MRLLLVTALSVITVSCGGGSGDQPVAVIQPVAAAPTPATPAPPRVVTVQAPAFSFDGPWQSVWQQGVAWTGCFTSVNPGVDGGGCFIQFMEYNKAGALRSGITLNGGLIDATAGNEQGDLDIGIYVNGTVAVIGFQGNYQGNPAGIMPWPPDVFAIGSAANRFASLYLTLYPVRPGMPAGAIGAVKVSGGYVPVFP